MRSVNQLFYENTSESAYATLFFAEYDDRLRRLRFANCGHLPALLFRRDGTIEKLDSTCTVLGLFKEWDCSIIELGLFSGDMLALYTDGITECANPEGAELGEETLLDVITRNVQLQAYELKDKVLESVLGHCNGALNDDATLIVVAVE